MKKIILFLVPVFIIIIALGWKQNITITGNIKDEMARPLKATVQAGNAATVSDANGNYKITVSEAQAYIIYTAPGYRTIKIKINKQKVINVVMKLAASSKKEASKQDVVVVAYGVQDKAVVGNVSPGLPGKVN